MTLRWTWRCIRVWLLAVAITAGSVYWWRGIRLSSVERQLIGTWEGSRDQGNGRMVKLYCELRADRTAAVEFVSLPVQPGQAKPLRIRLKQPTWRESEGHLRFQEPLTPWTRLQLKFYHIRAMFPGGTAAGFHRQIDGLGPIRAVGPTSFQMGEWHMERVSIRTATD